MSLDPHTEFQHLIDEMLTARTAAPEAPLLRQHLQACSSCREYLDNTMRAITALNGFSFPVNPALPERVAASLRHRAQQFEARRFSPRTILLASALALLFTAAGSFIDLRFSGLLATVLELQPAQVEHGLLTFWIGPSLCLLLVFPMLPLLRRRTGGAL